MGHQESANKAFGLALQQLPGDKLLTQLIDMTTPVGKETKTPPPVPPAPDDLAAEKVLSVEQMVGTPLGTNPGWSLNKRSRLDQNESFAAQPSTAATLCGSSQSNIRFTRLMPGCLAKRMTFSP